MAGSETFPGTAVHATDPTWTARGIELRYSPLSHGTVSDYSVDAAHTSLHILVE